MILGIIDSTAQILNENGAISVKKNQVICIGAFYIETFSTLYHGIKFSLLRLR